MGGASQAKSATRVPWIQWIQGTNPLNDEDKNFIIAIGQKAQRAFLIPQISIKFFKNMIEFSLNIRNNKCNYKTNRAGLEKRMVYEDW